MNELDDFISAKESLVAIVVIVWTEGDRHFVAKWSVLHMFHIRCCRGLGGLWGFQLGSTKWTTIFPWIVSAEIILFWKLKMWKFSCSFRSMSFFSIINCIKVRDFQKKIGIIYRLKQICHFTILNSSFEFLRIICYIEHNVISKIQV